MKLKISEKAYLDIESLLQYSIETFGIPKTEEYLKNLYKKISYLGKMPGIGHTHKSLPENLRVINVEKHIVIYEVIDQMSAVVILRVVHQKVNLAGLFE